MSSTISKSIEEEDLWGGGNKPFKASYGKLMMWFFIVSDALTFSGFLVAYGFSRFKNIDTWPIADEVFNHFPFFTWCGCSYVLCSANDICFDFFVCYNGFSC
jgi:cytochrome c oxidase subunit 3